MENMEKTPGRLALKAMQDISTDFEFKKPIGVPKRSSKEKVLDEETYIEEMGKIIQRDFFPDLEKLAAQNQYLEAMERNDISKLRELHIKYSGQRPPTQRISSPATFETPANLHNSQGPLASSENPDVPQFIDDSQEAPKLSLDQFLNANTSQDNQSFEEIIKESEKKHRQKFSYLYNEEEKSNEEQSALLALPSIEKQCALPEKKFNVDTWTYKNKNYIMYIPDGVEKTEEEQIESSKRRQEIVHGNTRLALNPFNEAQSKETINELAKSQAKILDGKIGVDGKELQLSASPQINGFSFIRTPSPYPGVAASPLMTWGEIEGTPFRLDGSDTPLPRNSGPSFKMAEPPRREQIAIALAEKVNERHRDKKKKAMDVARKQLTSPSPRPNTSCIDRLATMSPAARRLATSRLKLTGTLGKTELQSSYSPSPSRRTKTPRTPRRAVTPKLNLGIIKPIVDNLTDDLLNINVPKRQTAADFF